MEMRENHVKQNLVMKVQMKAKNENITISNMITCIIFVIKNQGLSS